MSAKIEYRILIFFFISKIEEENKEEGHGRLKYRLEYDFTTQELKVTVRRVVKSQFCFVLIYIVFIKIVTSRMIHDSF